MVEIKDVLSGVGKGIGVGALLGGQATRQRFAEHETERRRLPLREQISGFLGIEPEKAVSMRKEIKDLQIGGFESFLRGKRPEAIGAPAGITFKSGDFEIPSGTYKGGTLRVVPTGEFQIIKDGKQVAKGEDIKEIHLQSIKNMVLEKTPEVKGIPATPEERAKLKKQYDREIAERKKQLRSFLHNELPYYKDLLAMLQLSGKLANTTKGKGELLMDTKNMKDSIEGIGETMELLRARAEQSTMNALGTERQKEVIRSSIASITGSLSEMHKGVSVGMEKKMPADKQRVFGSFAKSSSNAVRPYLEAILDLSENTNIPVNTLTATRDFKGVIREVAKIQGKKEGKVITPKQYLDTFSKLIKNAREITNEVKQEREFNRIYKLYAEPLAEVRINMARNATVADLKADGSLTSKTTPILLNMNEWKELESFLTTTYELYLRRMRGKIIGGFVEF